MVCKEKPQFISQKVPKISYELVIFWWFWWNHEWNVQRDVKKFILTVKVFLTATASSCWKLYGAELKTLICIHQKNSFVGGVVAVVAHHYYKKRKEKEIIFFFEKMAPTKRRKQRLNRLEKILKLDRSEKRNRGFSWIFESRIWCLGKLQQNFGKKNLSYSSRSGTRGR